MKIGSCVKNTTTTRLPLRCRKREMQRWRKRKGEASRMIKTGNETWHAILICWSLSIIACVVVMKGYYHSVFRNVQFRALGETFRPRSIAYLFKIVAIVLFLLDAFRDTYFSCPRYEDSSLLAIILFTMIMSMMIRGLAKATNQWIVFLSKTGKVSVSRSDQEIV